MAEGAFRKLNVDQYDEDRVLEHELYDPDPRGPEMVLSVAKQKQSEVRSLLQRFVSSSFLVVLNTRTDPEPCE